MSFNICNEEARKSFLAAFKAATANNDSEKASEALSSFIESVSNDILAQAKTVGTLSMDAKILADRGLRVQTSEEKNYFEKVIECLKAGDPTSAFASLEDTYPETSINAIFDDLTEAHPLLKVIDCQNTSALMKLIINTQGPQAAIWGELNAAITKELSAGVSVLELTLGKCTAYMYIANDMLDLGPVWVEKYIRTCLVESLGYGVEDGIISGKGIKGEPVGMIKNLNGSINQSTGYPNKTAIEVTDFAPATYGSLLATLATSSTGRARVINKVEMFVNPVDYFTKILPAKTMLRSDGLYQTDCVPFPTDFIQIASIPQGKAIMGIGKNYKFGLGKGNGGKIEESKDFKFLEDLRTLKIKLYGAGRALDNNSFLLLDISGLLPLASVAVNETSEEGEGGEGGEG